MTNKTADKLTLTQQMLLEQLKREKKTLLQRIETMDSRINKLTNELNRFKFGFDDEPTTLFSGQELANRGINSAAAHADNKVKNWTEQAFMFYKEYAEQNRTFMSEDVRMASIGIVPEPPSLRAWGAIARRAIKEGIISRVGHVSVKSPTGHCGLVSLWESNICKMLTICLLVLTGCRPEIQNPLYFTVDPIHCGYRVNAFVDGAYYLNDTLIGSWCAKPQRHANLCDAVAGDVVCVDAFYDMKIDHCETLQ